MDANGKDRPSPQDIMSLTQSKNGNEITLSSASSSDTASTSFSRSGSSNGDDSSMLNNQTSSNSAIGFLATNALNESKLSSSIQVNKSSTNPSNSFPGTTLNFQQSRGQFYVNQQNPALSTRTQQPLNNPYPNSNQDLEHLLRQNQLLNSYSYTGNKSLNNFQDARPFIRKIETANSGCTCKKSKCLKLYCQCFASSALCYSECVCVACENLVGNESKIQTARNSILERNPRAFDDKFKREPIVKGNGLSSVGPGAGTMPFSNQMMGIREYKSFFIFILISHNFRLS